MTHETLPPPPLEIERKFLLEQFPLNLEAVPYDLIEQGYISITDQEEIRLRRTKNSDGESSFVLGKKTGSGLVRTEEEVGISQDVFDMLWGMTEGRRVKKKRYHGIEAMHPVTIDRYEGDLEGLVVAEAEFESEEAARVFQQPYWAMSEVTGIKGYSNRNLAEFGIPKEGALPDLSSSSEKVVLQSEKMSDVLGRLALLDEQIRSSRPILVGVGGRTSAGKTTAFITAVMEHFPGRIGIISTDDFAKGTEFVDRENAEGREVNYDHPDYYDTPQARRVIEGLKKGDSTAMLPVFNFKKGKGEPDGHQEFTTQDIIIVEGLYALSPDIFDLYDLTAFVDISQHGSIMRRLMRDIHRTNMTPSEIISYYLEVVDPMYKKFIEPTKNRADVIIENEYDPNIESGRAGVVENQVKFRTEVSDLAFNRGGAQLVAATRQEDIYFEFDRDTGASGESLRIRSEGGKYFLGYKGPVDRSNQIRRRNKFEARISEADAQVIMKAAGKENKRIIKEREIRLLDGVDLMVDEVWKVEDGKEAMLGKFIELHLPSDNLAHEKKIAICQKLGIDPATQVLESYADM